MSAPAAGLSRAPQAAPILIPAIAPDGTLFPVEKLEAHRRGLLHLAVSVFVFAGEALLVQQRAAGKYHCGLLWANTVCTHPHWGESVAAAAHRRLREELGLSLALTPGRVISYEADVGRDLVEHERVHVFHAQIFDRITPDPDPAEVAGTRWALPSLLAEEAKARPDAFAPWFRIYLARWRDLGF